MLDQETIRDLMKAMGPVVRQFIGEQVTAAKAEISETIVNSLRAENIALRERLASLEATGPARPGADGKDGTSVTNALIDAEGVLCQAFSTGEVQKLGRVQGRDGIDGKDGQDGATIERVLHEGDRRILLMTDSRELDLGCLVGRDGADGRGLTRVEVRGGRLLISYTDGSREDLGEVRGEAGLQGPPGESIKGDPGVAGADGADGVGIEDIQTDPRGHALAFLTDGRRIDLGRTQATDGKDGRGIAKAERRDDRLVLILSDGTENDLGEIRGYHGSDGLQGPPGESIKGDPGPAGSQGIPGRGIVEAVRRGDNFVLIYTDGEQQDLGNIRGPDGLQGPPGESIKGEPGRDGADGKSVDPADIMSVVESEVAKALVKLPPPKNGEKGEPGQDGKDADPELVRSMVLRAVASIPKPRDGTDGLQGPPGPPGEKGADADLEMIRSLVEKAISERRSAASGDRYLAEKISAVLGKNIEID